MRACPRYAQSILSALLGAGLLVASQQVKADSTCKADVVFLMDNTGSMGGMINNTRRNARTILDAISGGDPRFKGIDVRYGVATYWGDPREHRGGSSGGYHCPTSREYSGRYNRISLNRGVTYFLDMIDTWGDGWHGNVWRLRRGSTVYATRGATFRWGRYMSGGTFTVPYSGTYNVDITPYRPWGNEIRWRVCASGSSSPSTGYPEIARKAFKVNQPLTSSKSSVISGMSQWGACSSPGGCGGDWPEANYFALQQLATEGGMTDGKGDTDKGYASGYRIGWRDDAGKVIAWFGDAPSHCSTVNATEALNALAAKNIVVAGINTRGSGSGLDYRYAGANCEGVNQADYITESTRGTLTNNVSGSAATVNAILNAVSKGIAQTGSAAAVSFSTPSLEENSRVYQTLFNSKKWSGDVVAYDLNADGTIGSKAWSAAEKLNRRGTGSRTMLTLGEVRGRKVGVGFRWGLITPLQQADLRTRPNGSLGGVSEGTNRLEFLRGNRAHEDSASTFNFRTRDGVLGDIWHSSAVYVGQPRQPWPDSGSGFPSGANRYSEFANREKSRTPVVYAGANDGFLHGFDANTGEELIAYAPSNLFSTSVSTGYHRLADPSFNHNLYVDGSPTVSDVFIPKGASTQWRTVLVGIEGGGGRGLFALDVTTPNTFRESNASNIVLWEFANTDDAHLGYTFSRPTIALMNNGRWAAITGNGLNDTATDSTGGQSQLFIIYLDGGLDGVWTYGKDYLRLPTGRGSTWSRNGLFSPAVVDLDNNGTADRVYAGDLQGNLWAFDISSSNQSSWKKAHGDLPLFRTGSGQPITVQPTVARHPTGASGAKPNLMIFFGTGRFLADADKTIRNSQSFYGVRDVNVSNLNRAHLVRQRFLLNDDSKRSRVLDPKLRINYDSITGRQYGWYIDLPSPGERVVSDAIIRGQMIFFNTVIPDISVCASGGSGWEKSVKLENGGSPDGPIFDFNEDGAIAVSGDSARVFGVTGVEGAENVGYAGKKLEEEQGMPAGPSIISNRRFTPGTGTERGSEVENTLLIENGGTVSGRLSWQQLFAE